MQEKIMNMDDSEDEDWPVEEDLNEQDWSLPPPPPEFQPADTFRGSRPGTVFTTAWMGTGYYIDDGSTV